MKESNIILYNEKVSKTDGILGFICWTGKIFICHLIWWDVNEW